MVLDKSTGTLASYRVKGRLLLAGGPVPNFWRGPTDNDIGRGAQNSLRTWRDAGNDREVTSVKTGQPSPGVVTVEVACTLPTAPAASTWTTVFTVRGTARSGSGTPWRPPPGCPICPWWARC